MIDFHGQTSRQRNVAWPVKDDFRHAETTFRAIQTNDWDALAGALAVVAGGQGRRLSGVPATRARCELQAERSPASTNPSTIPFPGLRVTRPLSPSPFSAS